MRKKTLSLIYEEMEEETESDTTLEIELEFIARLPNKEYDEHLFDFRNVNWWYAFDERVNEDSLDSVLQQAGEDV